MRQPGGSRVRAAAPAVLLVFALACGDTSERPSPSSPTGASSPPQAATGANAANAADETEEPLASPEQLAKRGRSIYMSNCAACHNLDPSKPGAVGPEIAGSSLELIEAKVMRNEYPAGHIPRRDSKAMIALPYLAKELPAIHAFLAPAAPN